MAIEQTFTASFIGELARAVHNLESDQLKMALYTANADLGFNTPEYTAVNEVSGTGYVAGGNVLTGVTVSVLTSGMFISFANPTWPGSSFICRGALIYNASKANKSVAVLNFGSDKNAGPNFTVVLPPNTPGAALLRIVF